MRRLNEGVCSHCLLCGRTYYQEWMDQCPRCGGLCAHYNEKDLYFMERKQTHGEFVIR